MKAILLTLVMSLPMAALASVQNLSANGGTVEFLAIGKPSFIKIHGTGAAASGKVGLDDDKVAGNFEFDLGTLVTGIDTRDEHMKTKYLEVGKFPKSTLALQSATPIKGWTKSTPKLSDASFAGLLTLHGVTKPVTGKFNITNDGKVEVAFLVKLTDFDVKIPSFAGITVADDVNVTVKIDKLQ